MRISCVQMDMRLGEPEENFAHAAALLRQAAAVQEKPDVLVLPETWNTASSRRRIWRILPMTMAAGSKRSWARWQGSWG